MAESRDKIGKVLSALAIDLDAWTAIVLLVTAGILIGFVFENELPLQFDDGIAPLIPNIVAAAIIVLSIALLGNRIRQAISAGAQASASWPRQRRRLMLLVLFAAYAVSLPLIGYVISSVILIASLMVFLKERQIVLVLSLSIIPPLAINFLLARVLYIRFTPIDNFLAGLI